MGEIKKFLKMEYQEDGKFIWILVEVFLVVLACFLRGSNQYGIALLIGGMYIGSFLVSSFHYRTGADTLLLGNGYYQKKKGFLFVVGCFLHNLLLEVGIYFYLILSYGISVTAIIYGTIICIFTNAVGILIGINAKKEIVGLGICVLLIGINFPKLLFQEENLRFFSPVVQVGNMNTLQWWNLLVLLIFGSAVIAKMILRKKEIFIVGGAGILLVIGADIWSHNKTLSVPKEYEVYVEGILDGINEVNAECGMMEYEDIVIYKETYYPWKSNREKMVFYQNDATLYMNCFTESLCNMEEEEIVLRWATSALKPVNKYQYAIHDIYVSYLLGETEFIDGFTHEKQIEDNGEVVTPNYGLAAEIIQKEKERYGELYRFAKKCNEGDNVVELWEEREESQ